MHESIGVLGGDLRHYHVYKLLQKEKARVKIYGFDSLCPNDSLEEVLNSRKLLLPIPVSRDNKNILSLYASEDIPIASVKNDIGRDTVVYGGIFCESLSDIPQTKIDYYQNENFTRYNALLTAEGALNTIMNNSERALRGCRILIIGFGRIGKYLAGIFSGLGVSVTVSARKEADFDRIQAMGLPYIHTEKIHQADLRYDVILNTVPARLFDSEALKRLPDSCLFVELASKPYSLDIELARQSGVNVINAQGLPSSYAPASCARALLSLLKGGDSNG